MDKKFSLRSTFNQQFAKNGWGICAGVNALATGNCVFSYFTGMTLIGASVTAAPILIVGTGTAFGIAMGLNIFMQYANNKKTTIAHDGNRVEYVDIYQHSVDNLDRYKSAINDPSLKHNKDYYRVSLNEAQDYAAHFKKVTLTEGQSNALFGSRAKTRKIQKRLDAETNVKVITRLQKKLDKQKRFRQDILASKNIKPAA